MIEIRHVTPEDATAWARFRYDLWSGASVEEHAIEIAQFFTGTLEEPSAVLAAHDSNQNEMIGFAELSIRHQVPGCTTDRIGFVEGLYVVPSCRHRGIGRKLLRAAQAWAKQIGCSEFASDRPHGFIIDRRFGEHGAVG
jgi:aminoglycoside 6'-N-acetyltransferase I